MSGSALFLTHSPPRPSVSGDRIRTFHLMRQLRARGWRLSLFSLVPPDEPAGLDAVLPLAADDWELVPQGVGTLRRAVRLALGIVTRRAFQRDWFVSPFATRACHALLARSPRTVLFVEQLYMYPFVPADRRADVVLDTQNVERLRIAAMARSDAAVARRLVATLQIQPVTAYERAVVESVSRVLAVSPEERLALDAVAPGRVHLVPNGVDVESIEWMRGPAPVSRRLLYLGSMSYGPNVDAVVHFSDDIAPLLRSADVTLEVVGSNPAAGVSRAASRSPITTTVSGFVDDLAAVFRRSRAMIVPMRHGGGTRLKILEAMAYGLPVVTTSAGCAGLGLRERGVALIADSPPQFAAAVDRLIEDDRLWEELSQAGRQFVEERFDWRVIGERLDRVMNLVRAEL